MLGLEPLTTTICAEVMGVDLADEVGDDVIDEIRDALLEWKVLFVRDQHRLDLARHVAFGRRFGDLEIHPITPPGQDRDSRRWEVPRAWHLALGCHVAAGAVVGIDPAGGRAAPARLCR